MQSELLNEFIIEHCGDIFTITPTDKAYELLDLKDKTYTSRNGFIHDTIDAHYYRAALLHFLANNYKIDAIIREKMGNHHDESWQKEITIIGDGGRWADKLEEYRNQKPSTYESAPRIKEFEVLTPEMIDAWAKDYENEEKYGRSVLGSHYGGAVRFCFIFNKSYVVATANSTTHPWQKMKSHPSYQERPQGYRNSSVYVKVEQYRWDTKELKYNKIN